MNSPKTCEKLLRHLRCAFDASRPLSRYARSYQSLALKSSRLPAILPYRYPLPWTPARKVPDITRGLSSTRLYSTSSPTTSSANKATPQNSEAEVPQIYQLVFTCTPCKERSSHNISKQGYHHGAVLITCPGCKARHVISDHLGIFSDEKVDIEDLMRQKGQRVVKGTLQSVREGGDIEFWDDGSTPTDDASSAATDEEKEK